jgi:hypothetical protein
VLLACAVTALAYGLYGLLALRLTAGDAYPPYSTLRADPLGTKMLHDSLADIPRMAVERNYQDFSTHPPAAPGAVVMPGISPFALRDIPRPLARALNRFVETGGRLVVCFSPVTYRTDDEWCNAADEELDAEEDESDGPDAADNDAENAEKQEKSDDAKDREKKRAERAERYLARHFTSISNAWGVAYGFARLSWQEPAGTNNAEGANPFDDIFEEGEAGDDDERWSNDYAYEMGVHVAESRAVSWHSTLYFRDLDPAWRVLYQRDEYPVIVERRMGAGSIVLCADAYFLSNEAMVRERHSGLLAHLVGQHERIIFDEYHFGIRHEPGVMELARRYGLMGLAGALLFLAGLFVWKNATSLVPPWESQAGAALDVIAGEQAGEGFLRQLRRHVRATDLPAICLGEWRKTAESRTSGHALRVARMQAVVDNDAGRKATERNPVDAYRRLCEVAKEKGRGP